MKQLTCEMCGSKDLVKQDGVFVCQTCGTKYSVEEAKKMMVEGTVEVTGTVKVDNLGTIDQYLMLAQNANAGHNYASCEDYANKILEIDSNHAEAWYLKGVASAWQSTTVNLRIKESISAWQNALMNVSKDNSEKMVNQIADTFDNAIYSLISLLLKQTMGSSLAYRSILKLHDSCNNVKQFYVNGCLTLSTICIARIFVSESERFLEMRAKYIRLNTWNENVSSMEARVLEMCRLNKNANQLTSTTQLYMAETISVVYLIPLIVEQDSQGPAFDRVISMENKVSQVLREGRFFAAAKIMDNEIEKHRTLKETTLENNRREKQKEEENKQRKEKEKAKQKREQYWAEHADEKLKLEEEMQALKLEKDKLYEKVNALNKEKDSVPAKKEIKDARERISTLFLQKNNLGLFKSKEKKSIQEQIYAVEREITELERLMKKQQDDIEIKIAPVNSKLNDILNRIREIEQEFSKER